MHLEHFEICKLKLGLIKKFIYCNSTLYFMLVALAQMVACLPLVQQVWSSIPGGVVKFNSKQKV